MSSDNGKLKKFINELESNIGAVVFVILTILLGLQVISRYIFKHAFTWTEELSVILFVLMVYVGVSGAAIERKHLKIDFAQEMAPFKIKKIMLIISDIIMIIFCGLIIPPLMKVIGNLGGSTTAILGISKKATYMIIPITMVTTIVRLVQNITKLIKEDEEELGATKPILDLDAIEREYYLKSCKEEDK